MTAFAAVGGAMSGTGQGQSSVPLMTAGWNPSNRAGRASIETKPYVAATAAYPAGAMAAFAALDDAAAQAAVMREDPPPATPTLGAFVPQVDPKVTPADPSDAESAEPDTQTVAIERGDTLSGLLSEAGVQSSDVQAVLAALKPLYDIASIKAGQNFTLTFGRLPNAQEAASGPSGPVLLSVALKPSIERDIIVERSDGGGYKASEIVKTLTERTDRAYGVINGSLYQAALAAGVPEGAIAELIRIYSYDVDFQRDIQAGDRFDVLFTRYYDDQGTPVKSGTVLHATLTLQGERKPLYRFTHPDEQTVDYYNAHGMNGKRMLMKTPIDGARLSSGFGMRRHPILGFNKMHKGTDFAAPTGTPIMASGNGVVEVAGWAGGYGRYVRVKHDGQYKTAYAHMSRFARGLKAGTRVRQGQVIGYVGTSGRSTGPHLHYEVLANNRHVDSQSVKLPTGTLLAGASMAAFKAEKARLDDVLKATPLVNAVAQRQTNTAQP